MWKIMTDEEKLLKQQILSNKIRYKSKRDKVLGKPVSYRFNADEIKQIIYEYTELKLSCREIGRIHSRDHTNIGRLLKRNNIKIKSSLELSKKYTLNESYFENIDCHKKAYWLGWLMSDGSVSRNGKEFRVKLQTRDKYILEEFARDLGYNGKLKYKKTKPTGLLKKCGKQEFYESYELRICSSKMVLDLAKYGIVWNKGKLNMDIKNIPLEYFCSFILGEFEGDGSIIKMTNRNSYYFYIWDNENICKQIKDYFSTKFGREIGYTYKRRDGNVFELKVSKKKDVFDIYNDIYKQKDFKFSLIRKENKFLDFIRIYE